MHRHTTPCPSPRQACRHERTARRVAAALAAIVVVATLAAPSPLAAREPVAEPRLGLSARLAGRAEVERRAGVDYEMLKRRASAAGALAPDSHVTVRRLRRIAAQMIPLAPALNGHAREWRWEINLIGSRELNAFCMPGGKIAFFSGIVDTLRLTDDEIAAIMGHEIAHALLEHGRSRTGKARAAQAITIGASIASQVFGYGDLGGQLAGGAARLTLLKYSRDDEIAADREGMRLAARAGFDPRAAIVLWQKMSAATSRQPPQWLSTHPSHARRLETLSALLPTTMPLYARARGADPAMLPPYRSNFGQPVP